MNFIVFLVVFNLLCPRKNVSYTPTRNICMLKATRKLHIYKNTLVKAIDRTVIEPLHTNLKSWFKLKLFTSSWFSSACSRRFSTPKTQKKQTNCDKHFYSIHLNMLTSFVNMRPLSIVTNKMCKNVKCSWFKCCLTVEIAAALLQTWECPFKDCKVISRL